MPRKIAIVMLLLLVAFVATQQLQHRTPRQALIHTSIVLLNAGEHDNGL